MLYETITELEHHRGEPADVSTTDISNIERSALSQGMDETIQKTNRTSLWHRHNHPVENII